HVIAPPQRVPVVAHVAVRRWLAVSLLELWPLRVGRPVLLQRAQNSSNTPDESIAMPPPRTCSKMARGSAGAGKSLPSIVTLRSGNTSFSSYAHLEICPRSTRARVSARTETKHQPPWAYMDAAVVESRRVQARIDVQVRRPVAHASDARKV